ncbi:MAG: hypothetical protein ABH828_02240 [archaeon]
MNVEPVDDFELEEICHNCGEYHGSEFSSNWDWHSPVTHYKTTNCQHCGYETNIRTRKHTSGLNNN